jgi:hypothetical protein
MGSGMLERFFIARRSLVKFCPRSRSASAQAIVVALGAVFGLALDACAPIDSNSSLDASSDPDLVERKKPPPPADARRTGDAPSADAYGGGGGGDPASPGIVSCYAGYDPGATCSTPTHCCFSNYSAAHDGECTTALCGWGTIGCDGPEDCPSGQRCCAHALADPEYGILGYKLACQATACGASPANEELCHPVAAAATTCATGKSCVSAASFDFDLPPALYICR